VRGEKRLKQVLGMPMVVTIVLGVHPGAHVGQ
jgi:hypothetical protein